MTGKPLANACTSGLERTLESDEGSMENPANESKTSLPDCGPRPQAPPGHTRSRKVTVRFDGPATPGRSQAVTTSAGAALRRAEARTFSLSDFS
jgi:hypothetical protein